MIDMQRSLRHMAWANAWLFARLSEYPAAALTARYTPSSSTAAELCAHIVDGAQWYRHCLTGAMWRDVRIPAHRDDVVELARYLAELDDVLLEQVVLDDAEVRFEDENGPSQALRSTILSQACLHAVEHRAQIACALEVAGFDTLNLDDADFWSFERWERSR